MAAVEHAVKERVEGIFVGLHYVCKALRTLRQEVETKHTSDTVGGEGHAGGFVGPGLHLYIGVALVYMLLTIPSSKLVKHLEKKMAYSNAE